MPKPPKGRTNRLLGIRRTRHEAAGGSNRSRRLSRRLGPSVPVRFEQLGGAFGNRRPRGMRVAEAPPRVAVHSADVLSESLRVMEKLFVHGNIVSTAESAMAGELSNQLSQDLLRIQLVESKECERTRHAIGMQLAGVCTLPGWPNGPQRVIGAIYLMRGGIRDGSFTQDLPF